MPGHVEGEFIDGAFTGYGIEGWIENDSAVLLRDGYDLWKIDPDGAIPPVNLTGGYGRAHNTRFRLLDFRRSLSVGGISKPIRTRETLLLTALDVTTKMNGFFKLPLATGGRLEKLVLEPRQYYIEDGPTNFYQAPMHVPEKAEHSDTYLVQRQSATESPNLYLTHDFKQFRALTDENPQRKYNWYTTELLRWTLPDGAENEGILFKPNDFDPSKKYPLIMYVYERGSDYLNMFFPPMEGSYGGLDLAWYVNHGYLVLFPEIRSKIGSPGQSACDAVVSSFNYLSHLPYVDVKHLGLQGHSHGSYETNYIVSHTDVFAAAAPAEGVSDIVSIYANDFHFYYETGQGNLGATLWQRPDLYVDNSPIFRADRVLTPLLILSNKGDRFGDHQGEEWYYSLRRLGKKAWMLTYDGEDHTLDAKENRIDYATRLGQFFDYYLKGAPAPKWMTMGAAAGIGEGLELDTSGREP